MDGDDVLRVRGVVFDLLPQFGDVGVDGSGKWNSVISPHGIEQLLPCLQIERHGGISFHYQKVTIVPLH